VIPTTTERPAGTHRQMLGKAREEHIPPLVADGFRHVGQQPLTLPGGCPAVLLQELHDEPPPHVKVRLIGDEGGEPSDAHRLVVHSHTVAKSRHPHPPEDAWPQLPGGAEVPGSGGGA
jgi:hypothetical protein